MICEQRLQTYQQTNNQQYIVLFPPEKRTFSIKNRPKKGLFPILVLGFKNKFGGKAEPASKKI